MRVGSLGDIVFETSAEKVLTPSSFGVARSARYEDHPVQGDLPRPEFVAPELATFDLDIRLRADLGVNPAETAAQISRYCKQGEVLRLIIAGYNLGKVTVRDVRQTWKHLGVNGKGVQSVNLALQLKEYV